MLAAATNTISRLATTPMMGPPRHSALPAAQLVRGSAGPIVDGVPDPVLDLWAPGTRRTFTRPAPVQELASDAAQEAFGTGIRSWHSHRRLDHLDAGRIEHRVEHSGDLGVAASDQEPATPASPVEVHHQVTGQLGQPDTGGVCGDAQNVDLTSRVLDDEEPGSRRPCPTLTARAEPPSPRADKRSDRST